MITFIKGQLIDKSPTHCVIETQGLGYFINISLNTFSELPESGMAQLFTHFHVREDIQALYGFSTRKEREVFRQLISVSGVGVSTALITLSSMSADEVQQAIASANVVLIKKVKGIGAKTAQRIIIDLQDKILKTVDLDAFSTGLDNSMREEALSALDVLGFSRKQTERIIDNILKNEPKQDVESLIKQALKNM